MKEKTKALIMSFGIGVAVGFVYTLGYEGASIGVITYFVSLILFLGQMDNSNMGGDK